MTGPGEGMGGGARGGTLSSSGMSSVQSVGREAPWLHPGPSTMPQMSPLVKLF